MQLGLAHLAVGKADQCNALEFAPIAAPIFAIEPHRVPDTGAAGHDLDDPEFSNDLEIGHLGQVPIVMLLARQPESRPDANRQPRPDARPAAVAGAYPRLEVPPYVGSVPPAGTDAAAYHA